MSTTNREHTSAAMEPDSEVPVSDLSTQQVDPLTSHQIKGGAELRPKQTAHDVSNVQAKGSA